MNSSAEAKLVAEPSRMQVLEEKSRMGLSIIFLSRLWRSGCATWNPSGSKISANACAA
jgi:hypothetical protein